MEYWIEDFPVTGTTDDPQDVLYADLEDKAGRSLPPLFASAPDVAVYNSDVDRGANKVRGSVNTTGFQIAMSDITGDISITSVLVTLKITGGV